MYTKFMKDEEGQGLVEYALIILLVAIAVVGLLTAVGTDLGVAFSNISTAITTAGGS